MAKQKQTIWPLGGIISFNDGASMQRGADSVYQAILSGISGLQQDDADKAVAETEKTAIRVFTHPIVFDVAEKDSAGTDVEETSGAGDTDLGKKIVALARKQIGKKVQNSTMGPDTFDASGLAYYCYKEAAKMQLPRTVKEQASSEKGRKILGANPTMAQFKAKVQPGDLIFFGNPINHVGICVSGDSNQYIEAPATNGKKVWYRSFGGRDDVAGIFRYVKDSASSSGKSDFDFSGYTFSREYTAKNTSGKLKEYRFIVLHHTGPGGDENLAQYLAGSNEREVSVQFVVGRKGQIWQLVSDIKTKCHHAGKSSWKGYTSLNGYSIGIEICNNGDGERYPEAQLKAVDAVIAYIDSKTNIVGEIVAHKDIAPGRKDDPSTKFPLKNYKKWRMHKQSSEGKSSTSSGSTKKYA